MSQQPLVPLSNMPIAEPKQTIAKCPGTPLNLKPQNIIDVKHLFRGRKVMREKQEVQIEEIGNEL